MTETIDNPLQQSSTDMMTPVHPLVKTIAVLGSRTTGKSTFLRAITDDPVPQTSPYSGFGYVRLRRMQAQVFECDAEVLRQILRDVTHIALIFDCDYAETHLALYELFLPYVRKLGKIMVFGNMRHECSEWALKDKTKNLFGEHVPCAIVDFRDQVAVKRAFDSFL